MNTPRRGTYRWMVFRDGDFWVGVAIEFNIVVTGDEPHIVEIELQEAVLGYLESAKKIKGCRTSQVNGILNQRADREYEEKWMKATQPQKEVVSPFSDIYKAGISNLAVT